MRWKWAIKLALSLSKRDEKTLKALHRKKKWVRLACSEILTENIRRKDVLDCIRESRHPTKNTSCGYLRRAMVPLFFGKRHDTDSRKKRMHPKSEKLCQLQKTIIVGATGIPEAVSGVSTWATWSWCCGSSIETKSLVDGLANSFFAKLNHTPPRPALPRPAQLSFTIELCSVVWWIATIILCCKCRCYNFSCLIGFITAVGRRSAEQIAL